MQNSFARRRRDPELAQLAAALMGKQISIQLV
jgi:hypothetical protein